MLFTNNRPWESSKSLGVENKSKNSRTSADFKVSLGKKLLNKIFLQTFFVYYFISCPQSMRRVLAHVATARV